MAGMTSYKFRPSDRVCPTCDARLDARVEVEPLLGGSVDETIREYCCMDCPADYTVSEAEKFKYRML